MKKFTFLFLFALTWIAVADTPPPGTVKAKTFSGDGVTSISATGTSLNSNITNSSIPVTGSFFQTTQPVSLSTLPALTTGAATIGAVNINGTVPISGTVTATNTANGATGSGVPAAATQAGGKDGSGNLRALSVSTGGVLNVDASGSTVPVSGAFYQATQPVSAASLPLPSGAATAVKQPALGTAGSASADVLSVQGVASMTALKVDGSAVTQPVSGTVTANAGSGTFTVDGSGHTQPISAAALPLPSGASTVAKQPALGTAGTASSDVITVQGITSMTALKVDGSAVTQPVSGTFFQATQPVSGTFFQATQPVSGTFWQATQPVSLASLPSLAAGSALIGKVGIDQTTPGTTNHVYIGTDGTVTANAGTGTFTVDGSGHTQPVSGTVTANIGTSGSLALDASVTGLHVAQASTTSGQTGALIQGATTTAAPSYTTAKTNPLSLTTAGALRVDGSAVTQPVSGTVATTSPVNVNGSGSAAAATVSTVITATAPANAVGFILMNLTASTTNLRWSIGRTATTTLGQQLQPGRDSGFIPAGANISLCAESGTVTYDLQWVSQ